MTGPSEPLHAEVDFDSSGTSTTRVVLVGFMGAGKTTLARRWARSGGPTLWFDSDDAAVHALGATSVTDAFDTHGQEAFRRAECDGILERTHTLARGVDVWSLGGGALGHADVRGAIAGSCVVWLDAPVDVLWQRVAGSDRPLARDYDAFCELYAERRATYEEVSTVRVDTTGDPEELRLGRLLADHLPANWFGSGLVVGDGVLDRIEDLSVLRGGGGPVAVVGDAAVAAHTARVAARLRAAEIEVVSVLDLPMGEWNKQLTTVETLLDTWAEVGLHRGGRVLALGGGTLLDTVGFAASIYQRGVDWISIPTTLTSMVDAGIGGKTGVNLGVAKNVVGSVHMPRATVIDTELTEQLPADVVRDGFVEAAKTGLLAGEWLLDRARGVADRAVADDVQARHARWIALVEGCAGYKDAVVSEDPFDTDGVRAQLNLGHTVGHAIESATGGAVSHGAAVAIGIHVALHLSHLVLDADAALADGWNDLCAAMGVVTSSPLDWDELEPFLKLDKKRDEHGVAWTLLNEVGAPVTGVRIPVAAARRVWETHVHTGGPAEGGPERSFETASLRHPRVLVLFGVNLGQLGVRDAEHYGTATLPELVHDIESWAAAEGLVADCRQTDSLERFLHALHEARRRHHAVIVNPGAWTHHELAIHDALEPLTIPRVEVHLSAVDEREAFRRTSVIRPVVDHVVSGSGADGYREALAWVRAQL